MAYLKLLRPFLPYFIGAALCAALVIAWQVSVHRAYDRGYAAREAEQKAVDADTFRDILKEYNNATTDPLTDDAADCILRRLSSPIGAAEECGDL